MACEEGAAIQWKFNTGGVRNGLADQCQEAASRGWAFVFITEGLHVSRAVKNLRKSDSRVNKHIILGNRFEGG